MKYADETFSWTHVRAHALHAPCDSIEQMERMECFVLFCTARCVHYAMHTDVTWLQRWRRRQLREM